MNAILEPLRAAHDARVSDVGALVDGGAKRVIAAVAGGERTIEELRHFPACAPAPEAVVREGVGRAIDAFFAKKEARAHREAILHVNVGCAEPGSLFVSLHLPLGIGESIQTTYRVSGRSAKAFVDGSALADADLDGDGRRDIVWLTPDRQVAVRFTGSGKSLATPLRVPECEDTDCFFVGVPALESAFALVLAYRSSTGGIDIEERLRWNGKQFIAVNRLDDDGFEARFGAARDRERAVLDDPMFGEFGKLRGDLDRCASVGPADASCAAVFDQSANAMTKGGVANADARRTLLAYLGWQRCKGPGANQ